MDNAAPTSDQPKPGQDDQNDRQQPTDGPASEVSREELASLRNSTVLKLTGLLMLLNIPLALWVLLGSLGFVPFDIAVFWGWLGLIIVIGLLQLHPTIRRAREVSRTLRRFEQID